MGVRTAALAEQRNILIKMPSPADKIYSKAMLAEYLFINRPDDYSSKQLRDRLQTFSHVLNLIGGASMLSLPDKDLFMLVRKQINPLEFSPSMLVNDIYMAENLLALEKEIRTGRPKGKIAKKTKGKLDLAKTMFLEGLSQSEVAKNLNIRPSTVSNWINRYPEFRDSIGIKRNNKKSCDGGIDD